MQNKPCKCLVMIALGLLLAGCAANQPARGSGGALHERNEGYSLLYKLMSDESDVGKIFILKSADPAVTSLVKEISGDCQGYKKQLEDFSKADREIEFNAADLPPAEKETRDLIAGSETHTLLFSSGKDFEVNLLLTQIQAMNYANYLAQAIEKEEDDPGRKKFLADLSARCSGLHDRLVKLLEGGA